MLVTRTENVCMVDKEGLEKLLARIKEQNANPCTTEYFAHAFAFHSDEIEVILRVFLESGNTELYDN